MNGSRASVCRLLLAGVILVLPWCLIGCSNSKAGLGSVEGKVTVDGSPANSGSVVFTASDGQSISGPIQSDGTYRAVAVPAGPAKVTVVSAPPTTAPPAKVKGMEGMPEVPGGSNARPVPIPRKYSDANSSGLSTTVKAGTNQFPIDLSSR